MKCFSLYWEEVNQFKYPQTTDISHESPPPYDEHISCAARSHCLVANDLVLLWLNHNVAARSHGLKEGWQTYGRPPPPPTHVDRTIDQTIFTACVTSKWTVCGHLV